MLKCFPSQIGQVQKSLESCMDKQTVEFQTQVRSYLILLRFPFYLFLYINLLQVAGIKTAISLKEKVCKIMNKTYGRCFRSFAIETLFWIIIVG